MRTAVAMLVALVLGVGGGVTAAVLSRAEVTSTLAGRPQPSPDPTPTGPTPTARPAHDPLDLFVDETDLRCSPDYVLVIASGDTGAELASAIADSRSAGGDPHYLSVDDSCGSAWVDPGKAGVPTYVAYTGPYADPGVPCATRMSTRGTTVAHLRDHNTNLVKCVCILGAGAAPRLDTDESPPADQEETDSIWTKSLQSMLVDIHRLDDDAQTGVYDAPTVDAVKGLQAAGHAAQTGVMDAATWGLLIGRTCRIGLYDW